MKNTGDYDEQYFISSKKFQMNEERAERQAVEIMEHFPDRVLDVGCGLGTLVKLLRQYGVDAYGVDNAIVLLEKFWKEPYFFLGDARKIPFENKYFDVVFSSDFFEHVKEVDIDTTANEMKRVGNKVIAEIAFEAALTERQKKYHVTNKPREWWIEKLPGIDILLRN